MSAVTLGSNIQSLKAQRRLAESTSVNSKIAERLASGARINRAVDDAAGLAISSQLNSNTRVYSQAIRNIGDGVSLLSIADSAVASLSDIVVRLNELASQAANGTYSSIQRNALDNEAQALSAEYFRIVNSTKFNGKMLLDGSSANGVVMQVGYGTAESIAARIGGAIGTGAVDTIALQGSLSSMANDLAAADLNGDGNIDLAIAGSNGTTTIRFGNGSGDFTTSATYQQEATATNEVALADINNDGVLDLLTVGTGGGTGRLTTRLGLGNGTFGASVSYQSQSPSGTNALAVGDINNDGYMDVLTSGAGGASNGFTVFLGSSSGTLTATATYAGHSGASTDVVLGDLNNDKILDVATYGNTGTGAAEIIVRLGRGNGTFAAVQTTSVSGAFSPPVSLKLADFNRDGVLDTAASFGMGNSNTYIKLGNGNGSFTTGVSYNDAFSTNADIEIGDLNGDGNLDVVASLSGTLGKGLSVRLGSGNGTLGQSTSYVALSTANGLELADVNNDGVLDVIGAGMTGGTGMVGHLLGASQDGNAPLVSFSLKTQASAMQAISIFDQKLEQLAKQRGIIGASQSRLASANSVIAGLRETLVQANSRIADADIASDSSIMVRNRILQQAAAAVLAQANQSPALALTLLNTA